MSNFLNYNSSGHSITGESVTVGSGLIPLAHSNITSPSISGLTLNTDYFLRTYSERYKGYQHIEFSSAYVTSHDGETVTIDYLSKGDMVKAAHINDLYNNKAERDADAVLNNLAKFDSDGNPVDLGKNDSDFVHTSGDETVTGIKNFTGSLQHNGINVAKIVTDTDGKWIVDENGVKSPLSNVELSELAEDYQAKGVSKPYIFIDNPSQDQTVDLDITPITWVNELGAQEKTEYTQTTTSTVGDTIECRLQIPVTAGDKVYISVSLKTDNVSDLIRYSLNDINSILFSTLYYLNATAVEGANIFQKASRVVESTSTGTTNLRFLISYSTTQTFTWSNKERMIINLTKMGALPHALAAYFGKTNFEDLTADEVDEIAPDYVHSVQTVGYSFSDGEYSPEIVNKGRNLWGYNPELNIDSTLQEFPHNLSGGNYTIRGNIEKLAGTASLRVIVMDEITGEYIYNYFSGTGFLMNFTGKNMIIKFISNNPETINKVFNIQLEEGSTATDYQPPSTHQETLPELWGYNGVFDSPDIKNWKRVKLINAVNSAGVVDWSWTTSSGDDCILLNIQEDSANYGENKVTVTGNTDDTGWAENDDVLCVFDNTGGEDNHIVDTYNGSTHTDSIELYQNPNPQLMVEHGKNHMFGDDSAYIYLQTAYNQYQLEREARERNNSLLEVERRNNGLWGNTRTGESFLINPAIITQDSVGIYWDGSADPTCERTGVATNVSDFDLIYPFNQRRRVALDSSGNVVGIHSSFDTNFWQDGSAVDWSAYETDGWNCMVQVPKFWYRQWKDSGGWHFEISAYPKSGFAIHPAFLNSNGTQRDYYYISAFEGWVDGSSKLRSLPSYSGRATPIQPSTSSNVTGTFTAFQGYATNVGLKLMDWNILWAEQLQFYIEYADWNSQSIFTGITNLDSGSGNHSQNTGHTLSLGNASGEVVITPENGATGATETYPFSYRGHENLYGNVWKWVDGIECDLTDGVVTIGGTAYTLTDTTTNYIYPSNFEPDVPGFYPCTTGGGTSTYLTDYLARTNANDRIPIFGGYWHDGALAGGLLLSLFYGASGTSRAFGGRAAL